MFLAPPSEYSDCFQTQFLQSQQILKTYLGMINASEIVYTSTVYPAALNFEEGYSGFGVDGYPSKVLAKQLH